MIIILIRIRNWRGVIMTNILLSKKIIASIFFVIFSIAAISQENNSDIEEVVTVSSKIEVPAKDVVGSVSLITQSDLETRVVNDLQEVFENTIGVTVPRSIQSGRTRNEGCLLYTSPSPRDRG